MKTEHKPGHNNGKRSGLSPLAKAATAKVPSRRSPAAQAIMCTSATHLSLKDEYGDHADLVEFGGGDICRLHAREEVEYGQ
jgi:hypothetical protein